MSGGAVLTESGFRAAQTLRTFLCPKPLNRRTGHTRSSQIEKMVDCGSDSEILERFTSSKVSGTLMTGLRLREFQLGDPAPVITTRPDESGSVSVRARCLYLMENRSPHTHRTMVSMLV